MIAPAGPQTAKKGDTVELQCKTKASTDYTLVWKKVTPFTPPAFPEGIPYRIACKLGFCVLCLPFVVMAVNGSLSSLGWGGWVCGSCRESVVVLLRGEVLLCVLGNVRSNKTCSKT